MLVLAAAIGAGTLLDAKIKLHTQKDDAFDFRAAHTWSWHPEGIGDVKMALTPDDNPEAMRARFEPVIKEAVERGLETRKLTAPAAGASPDLHVTYYLLISTNMSRQTIGQNVSADVAWQIPSFMQSTQNLRVIEEGSLVIDVSNAATRTLVWRGIARATIERDRKPAERDARLRTAIADLFKKFP